MVGKKRVYKRGKVGGKKKRMKRAVKRYVRNRNIPTGFPATRLIKFRYSKSGSISFGAADGTLHVSNFIANSIYRPDGSTAHDALGFDLWKQMYQQYIVVGSKIKIEFYGIDSTNAGIQPACAGVYLNNDAAVVPTNYQTLIEEGKSRWKLINPDSDRRTTFTETFSARKFFNLSKVKDSWERIGGKFSGGAPNDEAIYTIFIQPMAGTTYTSVAFYVNVTIDYIAILSQPIELPPSTT